MGSENIIAKATTEQAWQSVNGFWGQSRRIGEHCGAAEIYKSFKTVMLVKRPPVMHHEERIGVL